MSHPSMNILHEHLSTSLHHGFRLRLDFHSNGCCCTRGTTVGSRAADWNAAWVFIRSCLKQLAPYPQVIFPAHRLQQGRKPEEPGFSGRFHERGLGGVARQPLWGIKSLRPLVSLWLSLHHLMSSLRNCKLGAMLFIRAFRWRSAGIWHRINLRKTACSLQSCSLTSCAVLICLP